MTNYPQKSCQIDRLVTYPKLVAAVLAGQKTQQRRDGIYAYPGEKFTLEGIEFTVIGLDRQALGDMSNADAQAEGYPSLEIYKDLILRMHAGMEWIETNQVWVHSFKKNA